MESKLDRSLRQRTTSPAALPLVALGLLLAGPLLGLDSARAHFQELIPSAAIVADTQDRDVTLEMRFTHPMANGPLMTMAPPKRFGVLVEGEIRDLSDRLQRQKTDGVTHYSGTYPLEGPGDHVFFLEPAPYWEPAEGLMIVHYTKTVVDGFGAQDAWDAMVGFPVEIQPLTRPYGLWTGNLFQGVVTRNGEPVPGAEVEIEYRSEGDISAPSDPFVTQVVKADGNGVFSYAMPRAGWWGFSALLEADAPMANPDGKMVPVETGALIWVKTVDMP